MKIYCPVCREELPPNKDSLDEGLHPLEGYRIDCKNCGLRAWTEDVQVKKVDMEELEDILARFIAERRPDKQWFELNLTMAGNFSSEQAARLLVRAMLDGE